MQTDTPGRHSGHATLSENGKPTEDESDCKALVGRPRDLTRIGINCPSNESHLKELQCGTQLEPDQRCAPVKSVIFRNREARENKLAVAFIKLGRVDQARAKLEWMNKVGMTVFDDVYTMLDAASGQHDWRSPWAPFKRAVPRTDTKHELLQELHNGSTQLQKVQAEEKNKSDFHSKWQLDRERLQRQMKDFTMWQIFLIVPWKDAKVVLDVDSDFTLWRVKKMIHESEGVSVEQQRLWLIRKPKVNNKSDVLGKTAQAAAARNAALRTSAIGLLREAALIPPNQTIRVRAKSRHGPRSPALSVPNRFASTRNGGSLDDVQSGRSPPPRFQLHSMAAAHTQGPWRSSSPRGTTATPPRRMATFAKSATSPSERSPRGRAGSPFAMRAAASPLHRGLTRAGTRKEWGGGSPTGRVLGVPIRQVSLKRVQSNPIDYRQLAERKAALEGDEALLTSFGIKAGDVLQVGIDEEATKLKQREAMLAELGELTGDDVEQRVVGAFHRFDIDNSGSIETRELRLSMMSLGIYLTDHELGALTRQFDEDGDGQFDLPEFHDMVAKIMHGGLDAFGKTAW